MGLEGMSEGISIPGDGATTMGRDQRKAAAMEGAISFAFNLKAES